MPIYAYRCDACGHAADLLRKVSDPPLSICPACGADAFRKQVTAAGFQLKGSGWYVTDFRGGTSSAKADGQGDAKSATTPAVASGKDADASSTTSSKSDAPAPAAAPAAAPAPAAGGSSGAATK